MVQNIRDERELPVAFKQNRCSSSVKGIRIKCDRIFSFVVGPLVLDFQNAFGLMWLVKDKTKDEGTTE